MYHFCIQFQSFLLVSKNRLLPSNQTPTERIETVSIYLYNCGCLCVLPSVTKCFSLKKQHFTQRTNESYVKHSLGRGAPLAPQLPSINMISGSYISIFGTIFSFQKVRFNTFRVFICRSHVPCVGLYFCSKWLLFHQLRP